MSKRVFLSYGGRRREWAPSLGDVARVAQSISDWRLAALAKASPLHRVKKKPKSKPPQQLPDPEFGEPVRRRIVRKPEGPQDG